MFAKAQVKPTLAETYEEAERVEAEKESIEDYPEQSREKTSRKRALLLSNPKEGQSHDFEEMLKMMQNISSKIIDLEKEKEAQKAYNPYYKKREDNNQFKTPSHGSTSMNLNDGRDG